MITYNRVRELFDYDDGALYWSRSKGKAKKGSAAGVIDKVHGYLIIQVDKRQYKAHRLIWLWHYGYMPEGRLDHRNRIKTDNWVENLREASSSCNSRNRGNPKNNKSGVKGVCMSQWKNRWMAYINVDLKLRHLGYHDDFDEAVLHRFAAEQCVDWPSCDSNSPAYLYSIENNLFKGG